MVIYLMAYSGWWVLEVVYEIKLVALIVGDQKAPFLIATTLSFRGWYYFIPLIAPLHPWSLPFNAECCARWHQILFFEFLLWLNLGLNPTVPVHWQKLYHPPHHHHHVVPLAWISLTLSRHFSLSFIASGRSSGLHPVSSHSCCMHVQVGHPAFVWPYAGVYRSTSPMSSSLLLQQCPACPVRLTWIVFVMGGRWPYSWCLVGCRCQDLFNIALNILV